MFKCGGDISSPQELILFTVQEMDFRAYILKFSITRISEGGGVIVQNGYSKFSGILKAIQPLL